jgi:hypothetical protein
MNAVVLRRPLIVFLLVALGLLIVLAARTFVAEVQAGRIVRLLDDEGTEYLDIVNISEETIPRYIASINLLANASAWDPACARHPLAMADLSARLAGWGETMQALGQPVSEEILSVAELWGRAERALMAAVALDPANPDHHLARGWLFANRDDAAQAAELERAARLSPINSPLRYEVAFQYLSAGNQQKALEHARALARNDDSYQIPDRGMGLIRQQRSAWYIGHLSSSYLSQALEIAWRCGIRSPGALAAMVPDNPEAQDALSFFLEQKGVQ